jgi:amino acid adenylation domain-containing protein
MTLLSGINTLFYRYTRQEDTIIGIPVAGRMHPDVEAQLGLYLNTVAIRTQLSGENSFADVLAHQKEKLIAAYEHQNYPFDELIQKLELQVDTSRSALFDVMVVLQNQQQVQSLQSKANPNGLQVTSYETERTTSQFDVSLTFVEKENLEVEVEFNTDIYDEILMDQLVAHLEQLLNVAIEDPSQKITDLAYITKVETTKILSDFNDTAKPYEAISVIELFEAQVTKTPNAIAVRSHEKVLTYAELNAQANQFANYLSEQHQITQNDTIGVCLERNEQLFVAILAVLKTGATYLPIDAEYPTERIEFIIKDSKCKLLVDEKLLEEFTSKKSKFSIENLVVSRDSEAIAYMIYTSGTTGNPKGVLISQHSFSDYVNTFKAHFQLTEKDTIIQQASIAFDTSIEEIFPILVSGGELIIQEDRNDIHTLLQTCEQHNVSILSTNPAVLQYLNENSEEFDLNFRIVISGGDVLKPSQINNIYQKFDVYNTYGPTESTVCTTYHKIENLETVLPIGKPIANRNVYIVDPASNQLQPIGVAGELCISGNGLANGYWNREETTTEKFVQNPFAENTMIYKSGDMARWRPDGSIDFLGRIDRQVKLRGYRIELAEIEQTIIKYSTAISNCVVTIKEINNEKGLVVYFTATSDIEKSSLKAFIQQKLPEYMVPSFYIQLETIPVTSNGKINYKALPEISVNDIIRNVYTAPENEVEAKLVTIWETILGVENIGTQDNFFELGGHSMKVIQLGNSIQREFAFKLNIKDLYETPTIQHLAKLINDAQNSNEAEIVERIII